MTSTSDTPVSNHARVPTSESLEVSGPHHNREHLRAPRLPIQDVRRSYARSTAVDRVNVTVKEPTRSAKVASALVTAAC